MSLNPDNEWDKFGELDPYFGVLTHEKYKKAHMTEKELIEFFDSGTNQLEFFLKTIKQHLDQDFHIINALDFGCGVGRVLIPLAKICSFVFGVDISDSMLKEASKNCQIRNIKNVSLINSNKGLSNISQRVNFIHSYIVFQHIPPSKGYILTEKLVDLLEDNGIGVLHYTYAKKQSIRCNIIYWLRHKFTILNIIHNILKNKKYNYPAMQMNNYNLNKLIAILQQKRCNDIFIKFTNHGGFYGVIIFFRKPTYEEFSKEIIGV